MIKYIYYMEFCKKALFFTFISLSLLAGCKNAAQTQSDESEFSLKKIADAKNGEIQWTQELEKGRLSKKVNRNDYMNPAVTFNPDSMIALDAGKNFREIYPEIEGFASLDIRDIDSDALNLVQSFFSSFIKKKECDEFMESNSIFSLAIFSFDLNQKNIDPSTCSYIIGKGYFSDNAFEIPVRLYNKEKFVDTKIYIKEIQFTKQNDKESDKKDSQIPSYKILDIEIFNEGTFNKSQNATQNR
ncbi:MAG: hypothetical protein IJM22_02625 [Treponema sp.]|nr:hypothetical protein [Treponema sp.]